MVEIVTEFLGILGTAAPGTLGELIPYLLHVFVAVALVTSVFRMVGTLARSVIDMRRL